MKGKLHIYYDQEGDFLELEVGDHPTGSFKNLGDAKVLFRIFNSYAHFLVSYVCALPFAIFGFTVFFDVRDEISMIAKIIFGGAMITLFLVGYLTHKEYLVWQRPVKPLLIKHMLLFGSVFGFLLNLWVFNDF